MIVCGPSALASCKNAWNLPTHPEIGSPDEFFATIANGVWIKVPDWVKETRLETSREENKWTEVEKGLFYNPHRFRDGEIGESFLDLVKQYAKKLPLETEDCTGYLTNIFETEDGYTMHFLAADYDTDIDHKLDEMRFHRSRVNYVNKVTPTGVTDKIVLRAHSVPEVFLPFDQGQAEVLLRDGICTITLSEPTAYIIAKFSK